jgi:hypothetical protein
MGPGRSPDSPFVFRGEPRVAGASREPHRGEVLVVMVRLLRTLCLRGGAIGRLRTCRRSSGADPNARAFFRFRN